MNSNVHMIQWGAVLGASLAAAITDIRSARVPNTLTLPLWLLGLTRATWQTGIPGLLAGLGVSGLLALPFLATFLLRRGGAGDAKLMGAIGAWLSVREALVVFCCVAGAGVVLALLRMSAHRERKNILLSIMASIYLTGIAWCSGASGWRLLVEADDRQGEHQSGSPTIPYAVAVFVGVCIAAGVHIWIR